MGIIDSQTYVEGTSPRARGKPTRFTPKSCRMRNIPACAGKTLGCTQPQIFESEHPRVRGENICTPFVPPDSIGTSPRARGKLLIPNGFGIVGRNIPACAGKTHIPVAILIAEKEHPRVRGENASIACETSMPPGTSPRARGKPHRIPDHGCGAGNIPACAGKTWFLLSRKIVGKEHPRVRGENLARKYW